VPLPRMVPCERLGTLAQVVCGFQWVIASRWRAAIVHLLHIQQSRIRGSNPRVSNLSPRLDPKTCKDPGCPCSADGTITVWAAPSWDCLKTLAGHRSEVTGLAVHPSGRMALSTSR